jgi:hypothetical protein
MSILARTHATSFRQRFLILDRKRSSVCVSGQSIDVTKKTMSARGRKLSVISWCRFRGEFVPGVSTTFIRWR